MVLLPLFGPLTLSRKILLLQFIEVSVHVGVLTVQLYLIQSSQKRLAENFFLTTTVSPLIKH